MTTEAAIAQEPAIAEESAIATRLSESMIWDLQPALDPSQGIAAWNQGAIPHAITSNAFMARAYVRQVRAFLRDASAGGHIDASEPIYVLELGATSGRLGFQFLQAWFEQPPPVPEQKICYVLTDLAEGLVQFWREHPQLAELAERGVLDFAQWDMEEDDPIHLQASSVQLTSGAARNPLVVIANDAFGNARQDAFAIAEDTLLECRLTVQGDVSSPRFAHDYRPVDLPYYNDPFLDVLLEEYRQNVDSGHVMMPLAAFRAFGALAELGERGLMVLSADMGISRLEELREAPPPSLNQRGCVVSRVNYHAITRWVEGLGGEMLRPELAHDQLAVHVAVFGLGGDDLPETRRTYAEALDRLGADAIFVLKGRLGQLNEMSMLMFWRISGWPVGTPSRRGLACRVCMIWLWRDWRRASGTPWPKPWNGFGRLISILGKFLIWPLSWVRCSRRPGYSVRPSSSLSAPWSVMASTRRRFSTWLSAISGFGSWTLPGGV